MQLARVDKYTIVALIVHPAKITLSHALLRANSWVKTKPIVNIVKTTKEKQMI